MPVYSKADKNSDHEQGPAEKTHDLIKENSELKKKLAEAKSTNEKHFNKTFNLTSAISMSHTHVPDEKGPTQLSMLQQMSLLFPEVSHSKIKYDDIAQLKSGKVVKQTVFLFAPHTHKQLVEDAQTFLVNLSAVMVTHKRALNLTRLGELKSMLAHLKVNIFFNKNTNLVEFVGKTSEIELARVVID